MQSNQKQTSLEHYPFQEASQHESHHQSTHIDSKNFIKPIYSGLIGQATASLSQHLYTPRSEHNLLPEIKKNILNKFEGLSTVTNENTIFNFINLEGESDGICATYPPIARLYNKQHMIDENIGQLEDLDTAASISNTLDQQHLIDCEVQISNAFELIKYDHNVRNRRNNASIYRKQIEPFFYESLQCLEVSWQQLSNQQVWTHRTQEQPYIEPLCFNAFESGSSILKDGQTVNELIHQSSSGISGNNQQRRQFIESTDDQINCQDKETISENFVEEEEDQDQQVERRRGKVQKNAKLQFKNCQKDSIDKKTNDCQQNQRIGDKNIYELINGDEKLKDRFRFYLRRTGFRFQGQFYYKAFINFCSINKIIFQLKNVPNKTFMDEHLRNFAKVHFKNEWPELNETNKNILINYLIVHIYNNRAPGCQSAENDQAYVPRDQFIVETLEQLNEEGDPEAFKRVWKVKYQYSKGNDIEFLKSKIDCFLFHHFVQSSDLDSFLAEQCQKLKVGIKMKMTDMQKRKYTRDKLIQIRDMLMKMKQEAALNKDWCI